MKKKNKVLILISLILIIISFGIVLGGIYYYNIKMEELNYKKSLIDEKESELIEEYENKEQYIGIDNCFLGIVSKDGSWYSATEHDRNYGIFKVGEKVKSNVVKKDITADDIISNESFYFYDENKLLGKRKDIFYDKDLNPEYYMEIYYFRFNAYDLKIEEEDESIKYDNSLLFATSKVLNTNYNKRLERVDKDEFVNYEKYVQSVLDEKNIKSEVDINKVILADCNLDGIKETYILSNSRYNSDENNSTKGIYSFVIKVENDDVKVLLENYISDSEIKNAEYIDKFFEIRGLSLVDFNNDGKLEVVVSGIGWDIPEIYVIRINESNEEELCLYGNFAW